jgi:hypothetical protein
MVINKLNAVKTLPLPLRKKKRKQKKKEQNDARIWFKIFVVSDLESACKI